MVVVSKTRVAVSKAVGSGSNPDVGATSNPSGELKFSTRLKKFLTNKKFFGIIFILLVKKK